MNNGAEPRRIPRWGQTGLGNKDPIEPRNAAQRVATQRLSTWPDDDSQAWRRFAKF